VAPTQPRETEPQPSFGARLATHNSQLTAIYMKTRLPHNFHFRIKYLTVTRPVDKMYNTQTHPQQNQILKCQTPTPGVQKKTAFSPKDRTSQSQHATAPESLSSSTSPQRIRTGSPIYCGSVRRRSGPWAAETRLEQADDIVSADSGHPETHHAS
jgi:hypothetical protein